MPREFSRTRRVSELVRRNLAHLIATEVKDPRVGMVSITKVDVSRDLRHARVYVTRIGASAESAEAMAALNHAAGFLRRELSHRVDLKNCPALRFEYDDSVEKGVQLSALIDRCVTTRDTGDDS